MRITKELREYVTSRVEALVPAPISKGDVDEVINATKDLSSEFNKHMQKAEREFIEQALKNPLLEGVDLYPHRNYDNTYCLTNDIRRSPASITYTEEEAEYYKFKQEVTQRIIAMLSVRKEVSDLDSYIENIITLGKEII